MELTSVATRVSDLSQFAFVDSGESRYPEFGGRPLLGGCKCTCTMERKLLKNFISSRDGPKKAQKQGSYERMQEDYPTSAVYFCRCRVIFLHSFITALFLYFFYVHPYLKRSFSKTFFPSCTEDNTFGWRQMCFTLEMNAFHAGGEHFSAGDERAENASLNFSHTHTASYQRLPNRP